MSTSPHYHPPPAPAKSTTSLEYRLHDIKHHWQESLVSAVYTVGVTAASVTAAYYTYKRVTQYYHTHHKSTSSRYLDSDDYNPITHISSAVDRLIDKVRDDDGGGSDDTSATHTDDDLESQHHHHQNGTSLAIDESELLQCIQQSSDTIMDTTTVNDDMTSYLHQTLLELNMHGISYSTRIAIAQYLILYHTYYNAVATNAIESAMLDTNSRNVLLKTNNVLAFRDGEIDEQQHRTVDALLLDTAIKLKQYTTIYDILQRLLAYDDTLTGMSLEEMLVIFTTSVYVGQWAVCHDYGTRIIEIRDTLTDFHIASENNSAIPDYECLYRISDGVPNMPYSNVEQLQYMQYQMTLFSLKLSHVECSDVKRADQVRALMVKQHTLQWQRRDVDDSDIITVNGGYAHVTSKAVQAAQLYGPCDGVSSMHVCGYRTILLNQVDGKGEDRVLRQTEDYMLRCADGSEEWTGQYRLTQETYIEQYEDDILPKQIAIMPAVVVVFDMRLRLQPI